MSNIQIFLDPSVENVKLAASKTLEKIMLENSEKNILLLFSGGSALSILSSVKNGLGENITISVLDERYSVDPHVNNFMQIFETLFYSIAKENGCKFIDTRIIRDETIGDLSIRFKKEINGWKEKNPDGLIIITQGMGPDGHTSGIMPYPENKDLFEKQFDDKNNWVIGYDAGNKSQYSKRVTTTLPFLRTVDISIMLVTGKDKAEKLNKVLSETIPAHIFPAVIIKEMKKVYLFTDIKTNS